MGNCDEALVTADRKFLHCRHGGVVTDDSEVRFAGELCKGPQQGKLQLRYCTVPDVSAEMKLMMHRKILIIWPRIYKSRSM